MHTLDPKGNCNKRAKKFQTQIGVWKLSSQEITEEHRMKVADAKVPLMDGTAFRKLSKSRTGTASKTVHWQVRYNGRIIFLKKAKNKLTEKNRNKQSNTDLMFLDNVKGQKTSIC